MITRLPQPAEELYNLQNDPHNLRNVVYKPENREVLYQMRTLLTQWTNQTDDNIPDAPTPTIGKNPSEWKRGEMPGEATNAPQNNHQGPVFIDKLIK
jgi:arylsulfatase